jgi:hypothetical protein
LNNKLFKDPAILSICSAINNQLSTLNLAVYGKQRKRMKKVKFEKKLSLNKETVTKLNADQLGSVVGGDLWSHTVCQTRNKSCINFCTSLFACNAE